MKSHAQNRVSSSSNSKQKLPNSIRMLGKQGMQFPYCMMSQILFVWQPELEAILSSVGLCCFIALFGVLLAQKCSFWVLTFWHVSYIFFSCLCLVFYFLTVFAVQKFLIFMLPHVPIFFFMVYGFFFAMLEVSIHDYATIHVYFLVMLLWLYFSHLECLEFIWGDDGIFFPKQLASYPEHIQWIILFLACLKMSFITHHILRFTWL